VLAYLNKIDLNITELAAQEVHDATQLVRNDVHDENHPQSSATQIVLDDAPVGLGVPILPYQGRESFLGTLAT